LKVLQVPRRTYYNWINHHSTKHDDTDEKLKVLIKRIWIDSDKVAGSPRLVSDLKTYYQIHTGNNRIIRLMHDIGIKSLMVKLFVKPHTITTKAQLPNLLKNLDTKTWLNSTIWRSDITYIELSKGNWVYMSSILDEKTRKIVDFKISRHMDSKLVINNLKSAMNKFGTPDYLHTDMGSQYTSIDYEELVSQSGILHSYSKKGHPYDNAPIEAFHSILKREY
jgi:transposase InsO family protein